MRYFYDTEFIEDGATIELISIGIVSEDGREYYAINRDAPWQRIYGNEWLRNNVIPHLPHILFPPRSPSTLDLHSPLMRDRPTIAREIVEFVGPTKHNNIELWGYYSAYDHVALCQLYGTMMELPDGMPMYTHELMQLWENAGHPKKPEQSSAEHHALADARWNKQLWETCQPNTP